MPGALVGRRRRPRLPKDPVQGRIETFSHEGRGIAHDGERTVFIPGVLPGELVSWQYTNKRRGIFEAKPVSVDEPSPQRVEPGCEHFAICGGCSLQHMGSEDQIEFKAGVLQEQFQRLGQGVVPTEVLPPLTAKPWGYRRKARLGVKLVHGKGRVLVGFREKYSPFVADLRRCLVLDPRVGERLDELSTLIGGLTVADQIPQIEVSLGDNDGVLIFRHLAPLTEADKAALMAFGESAGLGIYLQPGNESTAHPIGRDPELTLEPEPGVSLRFLPTDFTQVNADINRLMVARAMRLLDPQSDERVLDLFCGLGNFTLPIARRAGTVVGVEGDQGLVRRAEENAARNGLDNVSFHVADLFKDCSELAWARESYDKVLFDPPRSGALEILPVVARMAPKRIVYVSCNPATLARDAGMLVNDHGYVLRQAGVMDMFPHTAHVESIAVFERE